MGFNRSELLHCLNVGIARDLEARPQRKKALDELRCDAAKSLNTVCGLLDRGCLTRRSSGRSKLLHCGLAELAILNRNEAKAQSVVRGIQSAGGNATAFRTDVSRVADIERAIAGVVDKYGTINILVNNAAAYLMSPLGGTSEQAVDAMLSANVKGVFFLCQSVLPIFERNGGGKIINIGSIFGNDGFPGSAIYCATKGAISLLTKSLALELRERNIQVNAIAPGWIETPLNEEFRATDADFMRRAAERSAGRMRG